MVPHLTNQMLLFIDGGLAASGPGLLFEPDLATRLADGFTVGSDHNGAGQAGGVLDELATFNCPLAQSDVIAGYPKPAILAQPVSVTVNNGSTAFFTVVADSATTLTNQWKLNGANLTASDRVTGVTTNYTGTATNLLTVADVSDADTNVYTVVLSNSVGTLTSANAVLTVNDTAQLGLWLFTTTNWAGQQGQLPLVAANVSPTLAWSTNGVKMDTNVAARLVYRDVETNGSANINCRVGSVVLWFNADWSSGVGPGNAGRLIELGSYGAAGTGSNWWALCLDSRGTNLSFCTETNGSVTTNVTAGISWTSNTWHQVALTYGGASSAIYVDGTIISNSGCGVMKWPPRSVRNQGFSVGSDNATGTLQIRGVVADLETYNYVLNSDDIAANYNAIWTGDGTDYAVSFTNQNTRFEFVPASISGWASASMAILVNNTNLAAASWVPFNASPTVDLGTGDGLRIVTFYFQSLNGLTNELVSERIWLDTTPPAIVITSPGSNTLNQPVLQLQGYVPEDLLSMSYDLTNSSGTVSNRPVLVLNRCYDTNSWRFTTNTFQAFDLGLAPGSNTITLHAADLAGNLTNANYTYVLNYASKTNPVIQLYWPTNGQQVSGTNFTWRGSVDDPATSVSAQIVNTNGTTNAAGGAVDRNGNFWVANLPVAGGSNTLTLTATDVAGNVSATTIRVVQSGVVLAITSADTITSQPYINVGGTISVSGYTVWVNGVAANQPGDRTWAATNVLVNGYGTAVIQALAISTNDNEGNGTGGGGGVASTLRNPGNPTPNATWTSFTSEVPANKSPAVFGNEYHDVETSDNQGEIGAGWGTFGYGTYIQDWNLSSGGYTSSTGWSGEWGAYYETYESYVTTENMFSIGSEVIELANVFYAPTNFIYDSTNWTVVTNWDEYVAVGPAWPGYGVYTDYDYKTAGQDYPPPWPYPNTEEHGSYSRTGFQLQTGAAPPGQTEGLFEITSSASVGPSGPSIAPQNILVDEQTPGIYGEIFEVLPFGTAKAVVLQVPGSNNVAYGLGLSAIPAPTIQFITNGHAVALSMTNSPTICVGQNTYFQLVFPSGIGFSNVTGAWSFPGTYFNQSNYLGPNHSGQFAISTNTLGATNTHCWFTGGSGGTVSFTGNAVVDRKTFPINPQGEITIYRPAVTNFHYNNPTIAYATSGELRLGDPTASDAGQMSYNYAFLSAYHGLGGVQQLINRKANQGAAFTSTGGTNWLDNTPFASPNSASSGLTVSANRPAIVVFNDPPGIGLGAPASSIFDQFQDYFLFKPDGDGANIYVVIANTSWWWTANTTPIAGGWSPPLFFVNPPSIPTSTGNFPYWANVLDTSK